jgi:single-strand DNA-binding protein
MAETVAQYLSKGSPVFVEGRLKLDTWEKDGQKRSKLYVIAERMQFISGRGEGGEGQRSRSSAAPSASRPADASYAPHDDSSSSEIHEEPLYEGEELPF